MAGGTKDKDGAGTEGADRDSLDTLHLSMIPLSSSTLKNAKLIKNSRMETAVELYNDPIAGSLQIYPDEIADQISASDRDQEIINQLSALHSYDVYSLRNSLKKLGIEIVDPAALELSDQMKESLSVITLEFSRPLIEKIFGTGTAVAGDSKALQKIFRDPDINRVRENLRTMEKNTGIPMAEIPKFLEEYSEVFLSVAYYQHSFEGVAQEMKRFLNWIATFKGHKDVIGSPKTAASCRATEESIHFLALSMDERIRRFQSNFEQFWGNINRESFKKLRAQIEENHASMGPVLCGLVVKMRAWAKIFPDNNVGGPTTRAKFVVTDMEPGLEKLKVLEAEARKKLNMTAVRS
jgi:hypothetical protein